MDRLFDLMLMGVKLMVCGCLHPEALLQSSLWHLDGMKAILAATGSRRGVHGSNDINVIDMLESCKARFVRVYGTLTLGQLYRLRTELLHFFCSTRIKVSLYLTEGIQDADGQYFLRKPVRAAGVPVGTIKTVREGNYTVDRVTLVFMEEPDGNFFCHPMVLGDNLYRKDRIAVLPPPRSEILGNPPSSGRSRTEKTTATEHTPSAYAGQDEPGQLQPGRTSAGVARNKSMQRGDEAEDATARGEVQLLAALSSMKVRNEAAKLDLFIEEDTVEAPAPQESNVVRVNTTGRDAYSSQLQGMVSVVETRGASGGALDLLAMMDDETMA